jgi:hypothetical protein
MSANSANIEATEPKRNIDYSAVLPILFSIIAAVIAAYVSVQVGQVQLQTRMSQMETAVHENKQDRETQLRDIREQIVPRKEHEAHWFAIEKELGEIKSDLRDIHNYIIKK